MNQVAQGNAHEVRCDPAIWLYINKDSIATSAWLLFKPNKNTITNLLNYLQRDWRSRTELTVALPRQEMSSFDNQGRNTKACACTCACACVCVRVRVRVRESVGNLYSYISASSCKVSE